MVFLGFSHITARKRFAILLCCSDGAQTYKLVPRFNLEGGKTKIKPQNISQFLFTTSEIQGSAGVDFRFVKFSSLFSLSYFHCIASIALKLTV